MPELHFPWMEVAILVPLLGALVVRWIRNRETAHQATIWTCALAFALELGEWIDFSTLGKFEAHDHWDFFTTVFHSQTFVIDELSAPLLPLGALIYLVTILSTLRTKVGRMSLSWMLLSEAILLATFSCRASWVLVGLLILATIPPAIEMHKRGRCTRVYALHMAVFSALLLGGWTWFQLTQRPGEVALVAGALLTTAALLRSGVAPMHCWMTDLFEKATFGTAILFVTPLTGAYAAMRLVLPIAPDWALQSIAIVSLITAVYAAGMALAQQESRRFFCYLFLSNASLVLVGLELATPIGLTGALCVWLSVGISLTGFGITLRGIESRIGRISLADYHGLYEQMPMLAGFFLLTGMASIGFPATVGFVGMELLVEGVVDVYPLIGTAVVVAAALNGIAIMFVYFRVFTGKRRVSAVSLRIRWTERIAVLMLSFLVLGGGLLPQPGVTSRHHAAVELSKQRRLTLPQDDGNLPVDRAMELKPHN
ncbi:MAG: proton-conducting transporter membrane subunit [Pirellulaceae bacterium]